MSVLLATLELDADSRAALTQVVPPETHVVVVPRPNLPPEDVLPQVEVLLCAGLRHFTPPMIEALASLRLVQSLPAGADHLPPGLFRDGVAICSGAGAAPYHIAEHAFALLLAAARNVVAHTNALRAGEFDRAPINRTLRGKHLVVLGFGHVGRAVATLGRAAGMEISALNRSGTTAEEVDFVGTLADLETVLPRADYLVLTLPLTQRTLDLMGRAELGAMKPDATLVNVGRGRVIQEEALYDHLEAHPDFRAGIDVWWSYPSESGGARPFRLPFHTLGNFIMTPHVAGHVPNHRAAMMKLAMENIENFFKGKPLINQLTHEDMPPLEA